MSLFYKKSFCYVLFIFICCLSGILQVSSLQCKGEDNQNVDWYVLYKIPRIKDSNNHLINKGVAYLYTDSRSYKNGLTLSKNDITSNSSIPAHTLAPVYDDAKANDLLWLLYNDQPPNLPTKFTNGHSKGVVAINESEGFWLIHSVPNFPPQPNTGEEVGKRPNKSLSNENSKVSEVPKGGYAYPSTGKVNGQSFLCISINSHNYNTIGKQLMYNEIIVYQKNLPNHLAQQFTVLTDAAKHKRIKTAPYSSKIHLQSINGMEFTSFAKGPKWQKDLYDNFVAPELDIDLYTETWLNGRGRLPSDCNRTRVQNIESISLSNAHVQFKSSHDHSKWAVSVDDKKKAAWVCVGDINRAETQFDRGGGTVCLNSPEVWKSYKNSVDDVEPCPKPKKPIGFFNRIKSWFG